MAGVKVFGTDKAMYAWAIANLVANIAIVVTGGTVRLTGSGMGCPTWPQCTEESYLPHGEMGIHQAIEFGNRMMTFVLSAVAIGTAIAAFSLRDPRRPRGDLPRLALLLVIGVPLMAVGLVAMVISDYHPVAVAAISVVFIGLVVASISITGTTPDLDAVSRRHESVRRLALLVALGIPAQAIIGGVTVMSHLNPWVVGGHLMITLGLIAVSTWLVDLSRGRPRHTTSQLGWLLGRILAVVMTVSVWLGTVVTGSGPHSGDIDARRTGLDPALLSHIHAYAVYAMIGLTVVLLIVVRSRAVLWLLAGELMQGAIGLYQYWNGLPIVAVLLHMLGAAVLVAATTHVLWHTAAERDLGADLR